jgi:hypothetical protein
MPNSKSSLVCKSHLHFAYGSIKGIKDEHANKKFDKNSNEMHLVFKRKYERLREVSKKPAIFPV